MIKRLIEEHAEHLDVPESLDGEALLWAVYRCEKYTKGNKVPRFEAAYAPGGVYYNRSTQVRDLFNTWGSWAACSFSDFQILYVTAVELGYEGPPLALDRNDVAIPFVVKFINLRILAKGATSPEEVADAYNSGTFRDDIKPWKYMQKFRRMYDRALRDKQCTESTNNDSGSSTGPSGSVEA